MLLFKGIVNQMQAESGREHIKASQVGKLLRGEYSGEMTFGYAGEPIEGRTNRLGRPAQKLVICPVASEVVKRIFYLFVVEGLSYDDVATRLRLDGAARHKRMRIWTGRGVRRVLMNRHYIGDWSYGRTENVLIKSKGKKKKVVRAEPQVEIQLPHLQIIDDELFSKAHARINSMPGMGGRRPNRKKTAKDPLAGLLVCPAHNGHAIWLTDGHYWCKPCCKLPEERVLFSSVRPVIAREAIFGEIVRRLRENMPLLEDIAEAAHSKLEAEILPDRSRVEQLKADIDKHTRQINFILRNAGDSDEADKESEKTLNQAKNNRDACKAKLEAALKEVNRTQSVPTVAEVRAEVDEILKVLTRGAKLDDIEDWPWLG